jgi:hypothetical protein
VNGWQKMLKLIEEAVIAVALIRLIGALALAGSALVDHVAVVVVDESSQAMHCAPITSTAIPSQSTPRS